MSNPVPHGSSKGFFDVVRKLLLSLYQFDQRSIWKSVTTEMRDYFDAEMVSLFLVSDDDPNSLDLKGQCVFKNQHSQSSVEMGGEKVDVPVMDRDIVSYSARGENSARLRAVGIDKGNSILLSGLNNLPSKHCYSALSIRLRDRKGELIGILEFCNRDISKADEEVEFSIEDTLNVEALAFEIVVLIENASASESLRSLIGEVQMAGSTDRAVERILTCANKLIAADHAKLGLWSKVKTQLVLAGTKNLRDEGRHRKGEVISDGNIMQNLWRSAVKHYEATPEIEEANEAVVVNDDPLLCCDVEAKSSITVVLKAHRQPVGVLHLESFREMAFDDIDRQTIKALSQNVSIAVESIATPWPQFNPEEIQGRDEELSIGEASGLVRSIIEHIPLVMWRKDKDGKLIWVNGEFCKQLHRTRGDILGKSDFDLFPRDLAVKYRSGDDIAMKDGKFEEENEPFELPNGDRSVIHVFKQRFLDHLGRNAGTQGVFLDVAGDKYRQLFRETPISIFELNSQKHISHANEAALRLLGFEKGDTVPTEFSELFDEPSILDELLVEEQPKWVADWVPINLRKKMGELLPTSIAVRRISDPTGRLKGFLCALREISAGAELERALHEPDGRYLSKMKDLRFPVFCVDLNLRVKYVNEAFLKYEHLQEDDVIGRTSAEIYSALGYGALGENYDLDNQKVIDTSKGLDRIESHGERKIVRVLKFPLHDSNDQLIGVQGVFWNWEDHEDAQLALTNALNDAHLGYRQIVQRAGEGIFQSTLDGTIVSANPAMAQLLDCPTVESLIEDREAGPRRFALEDQKEAYFSRLKTTGSQLSTPFDYKVLTQNDEERWVSETVYKDSSQGQLVGFVVDITDRVQAAEAKEKLLRMLVHQLRSPAWQCYERLNQWVHILDPGGNLKSGNVGPEVSKAAMIRGLARRTRGVAWSINMLSTLAHSNHVEIDDGKVSPISPRQLNKMAYETALDVHLIRRVAADAKQKMGLTSVVPKFDVRYNETFVTNLYIAADSSLIEQCLGCVVENAFKYSNPKHEIRVVCTPDEDFVTLAVSNYPLRGLEIDEETSKMCRLVEWRGKAAQAYDADGTGLGLYLVEKVILAHGGELIVGLTDTDGRNTISLVFPLKRHSVIQGKKSPLLPGSKPGK